MEEWMTNLPEELKTIPLSKLAIPGSHNSGAYNLTAKLSPDVPELIKTLSKAPGFSRLSRGVLKKWCNCQRISIKEQLLSGIRYLDLRVSSASDNSEFYLVHGLYGSTVTSVLEDIKEFLESHPKEVVFLDFNHFYAMDVDQHKRFISQICSEFGPKMCEKQSMDDLSLKRLNDDDKQIICIYHHFEAVNCQEMWSSNFISAPWPNTKSPRVCIRKLDEFMQRATAYAASMFFVCQAILTPDAWYTLSHLGWNGVQRMTQQLRPSFFSWLRQTPGKWQYQPNIVIHDFVDEDNYIQTVLDLNQHRCTTDKQQ